MDRFPIARLRYISTARCWGLYRRDRNLRFHRYDQLPPSPHAGNPSRRLAATRSRLSGAAVTAQPPRAIRQLRMGQVSAEGHASQQGQPEENDLDRIPAPPPTGAAQ